MSALNLRERLDCNGNLTVDEVRALAHVGVTKFYEDVKAGRVLIEKRGKRTIVRAEIAKLYVAGAPMPKTSEAA
jgi:hypothetical protein